MAWLGTWAKRIEITIDHNDIDAELTHFPVLIYLSAASGVEDDDVSCVFDELTADENRKKIAVTKADGTTQLYVEIEKWDDANEKAWLWVSKSDWVVSDSEDTVIYLYYDSNQDDNTTYVGDTNDEVAESVWDGDFKAVHHLADGVDTSHVYDSTSNDNDGTKKGAAEPAVTTGGQIGNAQDFDGSDDKIALVENDTLDLTTQITLEAWLKADSFTADKFFTIVGKWNDIDGNLRNYMLAVTTKGPISPTPRLYLSTDGSAAISASSSVTLNTATWYYLAGTFDAENIRIYVDSVDRGSTPSVITIHTDDGPVGISKDKAGGAGYPAFIEGIIDEVRISSIGRSASWLKATYETGRDDLLDFDSEETAPAGGVPKHMNYYRRMRML